MRSSTASSVVNEECTWAQRTNTVCKQPAEATETTVATLAYMHQLRDDEQEADKVHHEHESPSNVVITQQGVQKLNTFADRDALSVNNRWERVCLPQPQRPIRSATLLTLPFTSVTLYLWSSTFAFINLSDFSAAILRLSLSAWHRKTGYWLCYKQAQQA